MIGMLTAALPDTDGMNTSSTICTAISPFATHTGDWPFASRVNRWISVSSTRLFCSSNSTDAASPISSAASIMLFMPSTNASAAIATNA